MTRYSSKQYARALYELAAESPKKMPLILKGFANTLLKNNDLSKSEEIMKEFEKIYYEESGIRRVEVSAADEGVGKSLNQKIKGDSVFKKDPRLIGGVKIKIGDEMVDNTLHGRLRRLKESLMPNG